MSELPSPNKGLVLWGGGWLKNYILGNLRQSWFWFILLICLPDMRNNLFVQFFDIMDDFLREVEEELSFFYKHEVMWTRPLCLNFTRFLFWIPTITFGLDLSFGSQIQTIWITSSHRSACWFWHTSHTFLWCTLRSTCTILYYSHSYLQHYNHIKLQSYNSANCIILYIVMHLNCLSQPSSFFFLSVQKLGRPTTPTTNWKNFHRCNMWYCCQAQS